MTVQSLRAIFQIKVTLKGIKPPIWRRLLVASTMKLADFHRALQLTLGWDNVHLHQFTVGRQQYGVPETDWPDDILDEHHYRVCDLLTAEQETLLYAYDFGDGWEHQVVLEKILPFDTDVKLPRCLKGKRSCPPEDIGGPWGYREFLEAVGDPGHPEYATLLEWNGGEFDAEGIDVAAINKLLQNNW